MTHEKTISDLAYHLWHARGCPEGSADVDWAEAERQVHGRGPGSAGVAEAPGHTAAAEGSAVTRADASSTADGAAADGASAPAPRGKKKPKQ